MENTHDEWTIVTNKRKINKKKRNVPRGIPKGFRLFKQSDYTLTSDEKKMVNGIKDSMCCNCCDSHTISNIINRKFYRCMVCYCCAGDDPSYDSPNLKIYVNDSPDNYDAYIIGF
jgi:hypothetical protein